MKIKLHPNDITIYNIGTSQKKPDWMRWICFEVYIDKKIVNNAHPLESRIGI